eukprot:g548.t1
MRRVAGGVARVLTGSCGLWLAGSKRRAWCEEGKGENVCTKADREKIEKAAQLIASANRVVAFTGAGISAESNIPTYRDKVGGIEGLWDRIASQIILKAYYHKSSKFGFGILMPQYDAERPGPGHAFAEENHVGPRKPGRRIIGIAAL